MDITGNENNSRKLIMLIVIFLVGLALGIFASAMSFQKKIASLQSQIVSLEQKQAQCESAPAPSNAVEPSNSPGFGPPSNGKKIPAPLP